MQIDLLISSRGEIGILSDTDFESDPSGIIYDGIERSLTFEFAQTFDSMPMNVPLADEMVERITRLDQIQLGILVKGRIAKAMQLPLMHVNVSEDELY